MQVQPPQTGRALMGSGIPPGQNQNQKEIENMTAFDKKVNQIAARHRWNIEKQARFSRFHGIAAHGISPRQIVQRQRLALFCHTFPHSL